MKFAATAIFSRSPGAAAGYAGWSRREVALESGSAM